MKWHRTIFPESKLRFLDHIKLAHYANAAVDIQFDFPFGFKELEGIHSRTDFDLKNHQELSGKKMQYYDAELNQSYIPYVVETSAGLNRTLLAVICNAYHEEILEDNTSRTVLKIPPFLAPVKVAVFPLVKKDGLPQKAFEIFQQLKYSFHCFYEEKDTIGKRYRRMDAIGTPYCITIDHQTLQDNTITIRERDTMMQERIGVNEIEKIVSEKVDWRKVLI
jgi:glycyl-tRNA synthetase